MTRDAVQTLAHRQRGFVTTAQLLSLGIGKYAVIHRARNGTLIRVHTGVYAVGHVPVAPVDRAAGALLACGPSAALSHSSAMSLWGFASSWMMPFEIIAPTQHRRQGIRVHRSTALIAADVRRHFGLRATSPARTLLDNAPRLTERRLIRAVNDARLSGHLRLAALQDVIRRFPRHPGAHLLRPLAETVGAPSRSVFEDAFLAFVERYDLPRPKLNVMVAGHEVDGLFEAERLIVELDGYATHASRDAFENDRERDTDGLVLGMETVRITWERLTQRADDEARRVHAILAMRRRALAALAAAEAVGPTDTETRSDTQITPS
jgi:very-short-patch-repair endonuclease